MDIVNYSPFPHFAFESRTIDDQPFAVVVARGTFAIEHGRPLRPIPEQQPVKLSGEHRGAPISSSLRVDSDLAPFKLRSDIHVDAIARAPKGRPLEEWPVRIRVGDRTKDLMVRGPHAWRHHTLRGWARSRIEPCTEVPLTYERAFGGSIQGDTELVFDRNPVGAGWIPKGTPAHLEIAGAQIMATGDDEYTAGSVYTPQGCGPIASWWQPRLARAGTFDDTWKRERWPRLPLDFDYAFHNSAHDDLIYDGHLRGDERIELVQLGPLGSSITTQLPALRLFGVGWLKHGAFGPLPLRLDTLHIDIASENTDEHRAYLTWRGVCSPDPLKVVEIRLEQPETRERSASVLERR